MVIEQPAGVQSEAGWITVKVAGKSSFQCPLVLCGPLLVVGLHFRHLRHSL